ncbi:FAD dependent oxidoreductase family protein [Hydrogenophaga sp. RAC07]|uniref:NAD(P)/FAD-dependent oxidoreductase n=1 Tax=Hydrogenophaga sp. RAC07 TaxID=1842537 RepID=UPI00083CD236|nr:FAD-binding oxidoreductase [Hydrogenophaga sp. RAC07]AOF84576.1 FAD dependent oxidoreductase family protein [Hydrogenophaga sp. RAC07]
MKHEVIVLGAGMVGVGCALHLQALGKNVAMVDRRAPGLETSYGNAGIIQREAIAPYALPRDLRFLLSGAANRRVDVRYHARDAARMLGPLRAYHRNSAPAAYRQIAQEYETLIALSLETHAQLMDAADANHLVAGQGYLMLYRTERELHSFFEVADERALDGVNHIKMSGADVAREEPSLAGSFAGAVRWTDPLAISSPGDLVQAYARLFEQRGGAVHLGDAGTLRRTHAGGWQVDTADGPTLEASEVVVALGPWTTQLTARFGYTAPVIPKRGYHMHYARLPQRPLHRTIIDAENGYVIAPMKDGLRLTTGAELANVDSPRTPIQIDAAEKIARQSFPLGDRVDPEPWMGTRPCMPDMKPVFGAVPGVPGMWCAFGHGHQGFTLGPVTGELLAAMMTGATPRVDVRPFSPGRFR